MTPTPKPVFLRLGIAALCLFAAVLAANLALRSSALQSRVARGLSRKLGAQVEIGKFKPKILGTSVLHNVTVSGFRGGSLSIRELRVRPAFSSFFTGKIALSSVQLEEVRFVRTGERQKAQQPSENVPAHFIPAPKEPKPILPLLKLFGKVVINNAGMDLFDSNGRIQLQLEGIHLNLDARSGEDGTLRVDRGCWLNLLRFTQLESSLRLDADQLLLQNLAADCGGGRLTASGSLSLARNAAFALHAGMDSVDLQRMNLDQPSKNLVGVAKGHLACTGDFESPQTWTGKGEAFLTNGSFAGLELLQVLGQIFQISELAQLKVKQASTTLRIAEGKVWFEPLEMDCDSLFLTSSGSMDFQRNLLLDTQLSLPDRLLQGRNLAFLASRLSAPDASGRRAIPFQITGTLDKPKTNLLEKVTSENIGSAVGGLLEQVLGGFLKPRKPQKPAEAASEDSKSESR